MEKYAFPRRQEKNPKMIVGAHAGPSGRDSNKNKKLMGRNIGDYWGERPPSGSRYSLPTAQREG